MANHGDAAGPAARDRVRRLRRVRHRAAARRLRATGRAGGRREPGRPMRLESVEGDITRQEVDAIVNAANSIAARRWRRRRRHPSRRPVLRCSRSAARLRRTTYPDGLPVGQAVATGAGDLPARWVIHTVGPNRTAVRTTPPCSPRASAPQPRRRGRGRRPVRRLPGGQRRCLRLGRSRTSRRSRWPPYGAGPSRRRRPTGSSSSGSCCSAPAPRRPSPPYSARLERPAPWRSGRETPSLELPPRPGRRSP